MSTKADNVVEAAQGGGFDGIARVRTEWERRPQAAAGIRATYRSRPNEARAPEGVPYAEPRQTRQGRLPGGRSRVRALARRLLQLVSGCRCLTPPDRQDLRQDGFRPLVWHLSGIGPARRARPGSRVRQRGQGFALRFQGGRRRVGIQHQRDAGMTRERLRCLGMDARPCQVANERVAQAVEVGNAPAPRPSSMRIMTVSPCISAAAYPRSGSICTPA